ncbi:MAG: pentapeptide repeat-containing protein [Flavobacteriaceae bacterium]|nr:pentapeptide repeat-containing protein [Flavobacteriaceae bacterium]
MKIVVSDGDVMNNRRNLNINRRPTILNGKDNTTFVSWISNEKYGDHLMINTLIVKNEYPNGFLRVIKFTNTIVDIGHSSPLEYHTIVISGDLNVFKSGETTGEVLLFKNTTFQNKLNIINHTFTNDVTFENCTFEEDASFNGSTFNEKVSFINCTFEKKTLFHKVKFTGIASFENTTFNGLADFWHAEFKEDHVFFKTDFMAITIFSKAIFEKEIQFSVNKIKRDETVFNFIDSTFHKALDVSRANMYCKLNFIGAKFKGVLYEKYEYSNEEEVVGENNKRSDSLKRIRESYRIIKNSFQEVNNKVEAMRFQQMEMDVYSKELNTIEDERDDIEVTADSTEEWYSKTSLKKIKKKIGLIFKLDNINLFLNKISNNHGTDWVRGLIFTVITGLLFYNSSFAPLINKGLPDFSA